MAQRTKFKGWGYRIACLVIGAVIGAGMAVGISAACGVFSDTVVDGGEASTGLVVGDITSNGMKLTSGSVEIGGNTVNYESSMTLTATVTPSYATDTNVTWTVSWQDSADSWVTENTASVSDYVQISASSSASGETITVYCLQAFGEQIVVTASADGGTDVTADCVLEYYSRLLNACKMVVLEDNSTLLSMSTISSLPELILSNEVSFYQGSLSYTITYYYGTGTMTEDYSEETYLDIGNNKLDMTEAGITVADLIYTLTGVTITSEEDISKARNILEDSYLGDEIAFTHIATGKQTGLSTKFVFGFEVSDNTLNSMTIAATNVELDQSGYIF